MTSSLVQLVLVSVLVAATSAGITLYEHNWQQGGSWHTDNNGCTNVPKWFNDKASSLDTHGECMTVFEHYNCEGSSITFWRTSEHHGDIEAFGFNDRVSSVKRCY